MRFHLRRLKAIAAESGRHLTWRQISEETGIRQDALLKMANNQVRSIRPVYVDALCTYFGVSTGELLSADETHLPLDLDLRPDRRGKPVRRR